MTWRKHDSHKEETAAVKKALADAGIKANVSHGRGTAWSWLHINIGDPKKREGLVDSEDGSGRKEYTEEEKELHRKVLKIAQETTGRRGDYDGEILIKTQ